MRIPIVHDLKQKFRQIAILRNLVKGTVIIVWSFC